MRDAEAKPVWLMDLCKNKVPGVILIDGDNEKTPCLDLAYEIGATMVETGSAERLCVWSWQAFLWLHGRYLMGDSTTDVHCWTITREVGIIPPPLQPLAGTLIEDNMNSDARTALLQLIHRPEESADCELCVCGGDVTIADFKSKLSLPDMERVNDAAKRAGRTLIVISGLVNAQGKPYETISYGELAMKVSIEHGVDLAECAESLISVRESGRGYLCRPMRIWNDDRWDDEDAVRLDEKGRLGFKS